ncbi:TIGR03089 family protein, partial [Actinomyces sp. MRS3W]|uniref:TIGR03089 family protein n=1 Tax=Actinomyces sp. MRS3W TaxID=2800796 RepID=UPI0028FD1867
MTDALTACLPSATDADRPWLVWYAPGERVELTGHVLHMWQCKIANLLSDELAVATPLVHIGLGVHWRTVTWCCGTWLAGGAVAFDATRAPQAAAMAADPDVSVAFAPAGLVASAELQVLVPRAALAVRWPGDLPPLVLDGVADLMPRADDFTPPVSNGTQPALVRATGRSEAVSRDALVTGLADFTDRADAAGRRAALVQVPGDAPEDAMRGVLAAWRVGLTAVLLSPDADADL